MALDMVTDAAAKATETTAELRSNLWDKAEAWLDATEKAELVCTTTYSDMTFQDEWELFWNNVECPDWNLYRDSALAAYNDGVKGAQSVIFWMWLTVQPWLYGFYYILSRVAHAVFGNSLPYLQRWFVAGVRMHMHFTWRQWLAEIALVATIVALVWLYRYVKRQKYWQRIQKRVDRYRKLIQTQQRKVTKVAQDTFREIAQVSLLFAMAIPHAFFMGMAVGVKMLFPAWVSWLCKESWAPLFLSWWYPLLSTVALLYYALPSLVKDGGGAIDESSPRHATKAGTPSKTKKKDKKDLKRRRSSGIGLLARETYSDDDMSADLLYWLNVWTLYGILQMTYHFSRRVPFLSSVLARPSVDSALCQLYVLFFIWIFCLPKFFEVFYPSAAAPAATRKKLSKTKQWCYKCALQPISAFPELFIPVVVPIYEAISGLIPTDFWCRNVVDRIQPVLGALVMIKLLKPSTRDNFLRFMRLVHTLVPPGILLFTPGFIAQYGVLYVQFIVPLAHSLRATDSKSRGRKAVYLEYWVLHCILGTVIHWMQRFFWWFPLMTHATFFVWAALSFPVNVKDWYRHFERELIQLHLLEKRELDDDLDVDIHQTITMRTVTRVLKALPSANSNDDSTSGDNMVDNESKHAAEKTASEADAVTPPNDSDNAHVVEASEKNQIGAPQMSSAKTAVEGDTQTVSTASMTDGDENVPPSSSGRRSTRQRNTTGTKDN